MNKNPLFARVKHPILKKQLQKCNMHNPCYTLLGHYWIYLCTNKNFNL